VMYGDSILPCDWLIKELACDPRVAKMEILYLLISSISSISSASSTS
jgi:hypothetical protein